MSWAAASRSSAPGLRRSAKARLIKLTAVDLDKLWRLKRYAGYSTNSVRIIRTVLRRALGQAEREGIIARNVTALSAPPRVRAKEGRTLTVEQARHLLMRQPVIASNWSSSSRWRTECAAVRCAAYGDRPLTGAPGPSKLVTASSGSRTGSSDRDTGPGSSSVN
jgi:hypothetical protein